MSKQPNDFLEHRAEQANFLRQLTLHFHATDKTSEYKPKVNSLDDLIQKLEEAFTETKVDMDLVNHLMLSYKPNTVEWLKYAKWNRKRYTRNLINSGNGKFNLIIICWPPDIGSSVHDHSDSHCFMKMLKGTLIERRYILPKYHASCETKGDINYPNLDTKLEETTILQLMEGYVTYINDNIGLHRIENPSHIESAASLHLYCPPFDTCSLFPAGSFRSVKCPVTFYSRYGKRCK